MLPLEMEIDRILTEHFPNGLPVSRTMLVRQSGKYEIVPVKKNKRRRPKKALGPAIPLHD